MAVLGGRPVQLPVGEERSTCKQKPQEVRQPRRRAENEVLTTQTKSAPQTDSQINSNNKIKGFKLGQREERKWMVVKGSPEAFPRMGGAWMYSPPKAAHVLLQTDAAATHGLVGLHARTLDAGRYLQAEAHSPHTHLGSGI